MKLSVIIPVYNGADCVKRTLASLTPPPFPYEVIAVDDGSTDETPKILRILSEKDPALRVIRQENAGPAAARNRGLSEARGEFILFCDADDVLLPGAPEEMVRTAEKAGADLLLTGFLLTEPGKAPHPYVHPSCGPAEVRENLASLYRTNFLNQVWAKVFRRDLIEGISFPTVRWGEDRLFLFQALSRAKTPAASEKPFYDYRQTKGSLITRFLPEKAAVCREVDASFRALAQKWGVWDEDCRRTADYMLVKSLWSCLTTLFSPSCPLTRREKKDYARDLLAAEAGAERRYPADCGKAFSLLARVWQTGRFGLVLATARAVALASRLTPDAARRAKHAYNR